MLYKRIDFEQILPNGDPGQLVIYNLEKTAGCTLNPQTELIPEVKEYISKMKPDPNKVYILAVAVAVAEYWGNNKNGDRFRYEELFPPDGSTDYGYKTLEKAKIYIEHDNRPNSPAIGKVIAAFANKKMGRVEVIYYIERDNKLAQDIVRDIDAGKLPDVSMGCRVAYDVCTICGKKARTSAERCEHIPRYLNKIFPDGRICGMDNIKPVFFDLSIVKRRAERIAVSMLKVASQPKKASWSKLSAIDKRVPMEYIISPDLGVWFPELMNGVQTIDATHELDLDSMLSKASPDEVLMTLLMHGIKPSPPEFCRLLKAKLGDDIGIDSFDYDMEPPTIGALIAAQELIKDLLSSDVRPEILPGADLEARSTSPVFIVKRIHNGNLNGFQIAYENKGDNSIVKGMYTILSNKVPQIVMNKTASLGTEILKKIIKRLMLQKGSNYYQQLMGLVSDIKQLPRANVAVILLLLKSLLGYSDVVESPLIADADKLFYANTHILPAAINNLAYMNLTKTASALYYIGAPIAALAVSNYLQKKERAGYPLTPTQAMLAHHPNITALSTLIIPSILQKIDAKNSAMIGAMGLLGYGIGQSGAKMASENDIIEKVNEELSTIKADVKIASIVHRLGFNTKTTYWLEGPVEKALAALLGGIGAGLIVGVSPKKEMPVVPYGTHIPYPHPRMGLTRQIILNRLYNGGRNQ